VTPGRARKAQPLELGYDRGTNGWVEPRLASARLPCIPDRNDFLRLGDGPALSLGTLGLSRSFGSGTLALPRPAVRSHDGTVSVEAPTGQPAIESPAGALGSSGAPLRLAPLKLVPIKEAPIRMALLRLASRSAVTGVSREQRFSITCRGRWLGLFAEQGKLFFEQTDLGHKKSSRRDLFALQWRHR
jgi:hypothetical protein